MKAKNEAISVPVHPDPCIELACAMQAGPLETCRDHRCPFRWQREAVADRLEREEKDRRLGRLREAGE